MSKLTVIDQPHDIDRLIEYLKDKEYVAFDTETTGLHKSSEIIGVSVCADEAEAFYVVLSWWNANAQSMVYLDTKEATIRLIQELKNHPLVMHNATYDCMMVEAFFKIRLIESLHTDTMILAHLLNENRKVGLKDLAREYFGDASNEEARVMKESILKNGGQISRANYELYKADADLIGKYGAQDTLLTLKLFYTLVPELYEQKLDKFFYEDESMTLLKGPTYDLNTIGLKIDAQKLVSLKKTLEAECAEAKDFIYKEIAPHIKDKYPGTNKSNTFNIGASQQLSWLLFGRLEQEFNTLTKVGKSTCKSLGLRLPYTPSAKREFIHRCETLKGTIWELGGKVNGRKVADKKVRDPWAYIACDKKTLKILASRFKWVDRLLEYQRKMKILTTYVKGIETKVRYGVIQPSFLQHGTTSGRYSSRDPNFQNLPRDDRRVKECIISRPGKVFVGADYSQLEPRVFASISGDESLMDAFKSDSDFYSVIGMGVYEKFDCTPHKEGSDKAFGIKYKKLRDLSKVIALASTYGATARQLMQTTGKNETDTQEDIDKYFETFPKVAEMMLDSHRQAKEVGYVTNIFGRPRRIPDAKKINKLYGPLLHAELPYEARKLLNLSVNHRIQSTGASIVNRAIISFYSTAKEAGIDCQCVVQVHDSLVIECQEKDAETVAKLLQSAMENTVVLPGVRLEAIPKIGRNLAEV